MITESAARLQYLIDTIPAKLMQIPEEEFSRKPAADKWSKKEELGHLVDSATNNHQRFVRAQFEDVPAIGYDQDKWNEHSYYQQMSSAHIIAFWALYNQHLVELVTRIPLEYLARTCNAAGNIASLQWLIDDYVVHAEHHLKHIMEY
ncbi:MAG: hypothetical protein JWQ38_1096 [Flavipsychrobacter sp.]|nr:hypothetical protein [Flavipsychrobacter sp.]